jgi:hypothetical protein
MLKASPERLQEAIRQTDAIFAFEGFEPTEQSRAINAAVLSGRVTHAQAIAEMVEYFSTHKKVDHFIATRTWA